MADVAGEDRRLGFDRGGAVIANPEQAKHRLARPRHRVEVAHSSARRLSIKNVDDSQRGGPARA
jgi:hypothetical protein